jgi:hypothetical protein
VKVPNARTIVGGVFAYVVLFLAIKDNIRFVVAFKPGTAGLVVVLCVIGTVEALAWWSAERFGEPGHTWLERSVLIRTIVLPPIAVASFLWPTGKGSIIALTVAVLLLGLARVGLFGVRLLEARRAAQREERRERRRAQFDAEGLFAMSWPAASEPEVAASTLLEDACRHLIGAALILLACLTIATNVEAIETGDWRPPPAVRKKVTPHRMPPRKPKQRAPEGRQAPPPSSAGAGSATETSSSVACERIGAVANVEDSTVREVERLFRLAGSGGAIGCPHTVKVRSTPAGPMYWSLSWAPGSSEAGAIVVISPQERPFVALAPAVKPIEALVLAGVRIGAEREFARYYGGQGYVYVILSDAGSWMLTKQEIQTGPLVISPPSVASAIRSTDKQHKRWLWARPPHREGPHDIVYALGEGREGPAVERVHYEPVHGGAWRGPRRHPIPYTAKQNNLPVWELQTWLPEPPAAEVRLEHEIEADEG